MAAYTEGQEKRIAEVVSKRIDEYYSQGHDPSFGLSIAYPEAREHVTRIGVSILSTKWGVGFPGGSFVQAIVDNNLMETVGRADSINLNCIRFYVYLIYNQGYVA
jgi:hypothetical protein